MVYTLIEKLANKYGNEADELAIEFKGFMPASFIMYQATVLQDKIDETLQNHKNLKCNIIIKSHQNNTILELNIEEADLIALTMAYVLSKDIHNKNMGRMENESKNSYDTYLEYLEEIHPEFEKCISFFNKHIGFDLEPTSISIISESTII